MNTHAQASSSSHSEPLTEAPDHGLGHTLEFKTYAKALAALLALTFITVLVSRFDFGEFNIVAAILIASVKAAVVLLWFMHLKFEKKLVILYAAYPILILALLLAGTVGDVATRTQTAKTDSIQAGTHAGD